MWASACFFHGPDAARIRRLCVLGTRLLVRHPRPSPRSCTSRPENTVDAAQVAPPASVTRGVVPRTTSPATPMCCGAAAIWSAPAATHGPPSTSAITSTPGRIPTHRPANALPLRGCAAQRARPVCRYALSEPASATAMHFHHTAPTLRRSRPMSATAGDMASRKPCSCSGGYTQRNGVATHSGQHRAGMEGSRVERAP